MTYRLYIRLWHTEPDAAMTVDISPQVSFLFDPANTDAVEFAKWLKDGNKPEPAEEGGVVTDEWVAQTIALLLPNQPQINDDTAQLENADGVLMSQDDAKAFVATLP